MVGQASKPGILALAEAVYDAVEGMSFDGTTYHNNLANPRVLYARADMPEQTVDMSSEQYPNLLRKLVTAHFLRNRKGVLSGPMKSPAAYRQLILSFWNEFLLVHPVLSDLFGDRIIEITNPNEPPIEGMTLTKPFLGIQDGGWDPGMPLESYQRTELVPIYIFVYHQTFPKSRQGVYTNPV